MQGPEAELVLQRGGVLTQIHIFPAGEFTPDIFPCNGNVY